MITNAVIICIDRCIGSTAAGLPKFSTGKPISIQCFIAPYSEAKYQLGQTVQNVTDTTFVRIDDLSAAGEAIVADGDRVVSILDIDAAAGGIGGVARTFEVLTQRTHAMGSDLDHQELFLRKVQTP